MTQPAWHAYYYEGLDTAHPPVRTEWIEAVSEDQAAQIARGRMGHCRRVELLRPRWGRLSRPHRGAERRGARAATSSYVVIHRHVRRWIPGLK